MKILLNFNNKFNKNNLNKLGGIEGLNINLFKNLKKKYKNIHFKGKIDRKFDVIISSNDAKIFNKYKAKKNILWIHNHLQIEKAIRKKQFLPIIKNNIDAVFVSKYLERVTSRIYNFKSRSIIPNFLDKKFENLKLNLKRKSIIVWSVQRDHGLEETIKIWIKNVYCENPKAELHIFAIKKYKNKKNLKKYNIFFHGRVNKQILIKYYSKATAMICLGYDETFCLNAVESFSCGTPVISFKKSALNDLIKNNKNGFKVDNFIKLSNKINYLINLNQVSKKKLILSTRNFSKSYHFLNVKKKWINLISK